MLKSILQAMNFRDIVAISTFYLLPALPLSFASPSAVGCIVDAVHPSPTDFAGVKLFY